jgi:signal transduction histidine kinase
MTGAKELRILQPEIESRQTRRPDACRSGIRSAEPLQAEIEQSSLGEARLRSISAQLLHAQEAERARVSRKLHDEFGQALGILKLRIGMVRKQLRGDQDQVRKECNDTIEYLNQVIENARNLSRELYPTILEDLGLGTALRRLVAEFTKANHCNVASRIEDLDRRLSGEAEINLYRIVQAALSNIALHALARNVSVIVERKGRHIRCLVEDDGCGFDRAEIESRSTGKATGLAIMSERARMIGASLDVSSRKGAGTRIRFHVPIEEVAGQ